MIPNDKNRLTRRDLLKTTGAGGLVVLGTTAGCLESSDGSEDGGGDGGSGNGTAGDGGSGTEQSSGGGGGGQDSYSIGMVNALTGSLAPYGERNQRGTELALAAINEVGVGSNDGEFAVIEEDSESTNQAGVNGARKLVTQDGVPLLIGAVGSGVSIAIYDSVVSGTDVVQISQNSTSPELTNKPGLLRTSPSGSAKGKALASLVGEEHDTVAVTWINNDYGTGLSEVFADSFEGNVAYNTPHDQDQSSYRGILSEMAGTDATAWVFITYANEYTIMVNEAYDQGFNEQVDYYGAESTVADSIIENTEPGSMDGMTGITESAPVGVRGPVRRLADGLVGLRLRRRHYRGHRHRSGERVHRFGTTRGRPRRHAAGGPTGLHVRGGEADSGRRRQCERRQLRGRLGAGRPRRER